MEISIVTWVILIVIASLALFIIAMKARYKVYTPNEFVLHIRRGKVRNKIKGGSVFLLPIIDRVVVLSTAIQTVDISASEKVISKENQDIIVRAFIVWRIVDPEAAFATIAHVKGLDAMKKINHTCEQIAEAVIRTTVANMSLDNILRERDLIVRKVVGELQDVVDTWGLQVETVEIRDVEIKNLDLFGDMQARFEQQKRLEASEIRIRTDQQVKQLEIDRDLQIAEKDAEAEKLKRLYIAQQEEEARSRELDRDRILVEKKRAVELEDQLRQEQVGLAGQSREKQVGELERKKDIEFAKLEQQRQIERSQLAQESTRIEAETLLLRVTKEAEAEKARKVLTQIDVAAESKKRDAAAQAEALEIQAEARAAAIRVEAEAEADKMKMLADATKTQLLAEAEGRRAVLLAEAEGLRKKVEAQQQINEAMLLKELIGQLPEIAKSMKVGEVSWVSMGGQQNGSSPMSIVPKNIMELLAVGKSFGLDFTQLLSKLGKPAKIDGNAELPISVPHAKPPKKRTNNS